MATLLGLHGIVTYSVAWHQMWRCCRLQLCMSDTIQPILHVYPYEFARANARTCYVHEHCCLPPWCRCRTQVQRDADWGSGVRKLAARSSCCLSLVSCPAHTSQKSLVLGHRMGDMRHTTRAYLGHKVGQHAFLERKTQNMPQKKCQVAVWPNQDLKACANRNCGMLVTTACLVSTRQGRHDTSSHSRQMRNSQKSPVSIKTNSTPCDRDGWKEDWGTDETLIAQVHRWMSMHGVERQGCTWEAACLTLAHWVTIVQWCARGKGPKFYWSHHSVVVGQGGPKFYRSQPADASITKPTRYPILSQHLPKTGWIANFVTFLVLASYRHILYHSQSSFEFHHGRKFLHPWLSYFHL